MALAVWLGSMVLGLGVGVAIERRLVRRLGGLAGDTTRGGVAVATAHVVALTLGLLLCAVVGSGLLDAGAPVGAAAVGAVGSAVGSALAMPLLPWFHVASWRFVAGITRDAREAGVRRPVAVGFGRVGGVLGYLLVWPGLFAMMVLIVESI